MRLTGLSFLLCALTACAPLSATWSEPAPVPASPVGNWAQTVDASNWQQYSLNADGSGSYYVCQGTMQQCSVRQTLHWTMDGAGILLRQVLDFDHAVEIMSRATLSRAPDGTQVMRVDNQDGEFWKQ